MKRRDRTEALRERLEEEHRRLLVLIEEAAEDIETLSAGQNYRPTGARAVRRLDALTAAEAGLSEAIIALSEPKAEAREIV